MAQAAWSPLHQSESSAEIVGDCPQKTDWNTPAPIQTQAEKKKKAWLNAQTLYVI